MKKIFTLLTLAMLAVSSALADDVTIGLTNALTTTSGGETTETLTGMGTDLTLTKSFSGGTNSTYMSEYTKGDKAMYYGSSTGQYSKHCFKWSTSSTTDCGAYVGYKVEVADGKTFSISGIEAGLAASAGFSYKVVIENSIGTALYSTSDYTITNYNKDTAANYEVASSSLTDKKIQGLTGTFYVKMYVYFNGTAKYICPVKLNVKGALETATADTSSPEITTDLDDANTYTAYLATENTLSIEASHVTGYQWYSNTSASTSGGVAIEGATSYAYQFTPDAVGTYYYYCVVTNSNATGTKTATSKVATVNVQPITPVFTLTSESILVGATAQIKVGSAAGLDGLTMTNLTYDKDIVDIDETGLITAKAIGTTTITFANVAAGNLKVR